MSGKTEPIIIDTSKRRRVGETKKWMSGDFQALVYKNADAMVVLSKAGHILYANPAAEALFNLSMVELAGAYFGVPIILDEPVELRIMSDFKDLVSTEMRMVEVTWADQPCYLLSFRDLTDRILAEQAINQSWDRLESMVEERTRELSEANERLRRDIAERQTCRTAPDSFEELVSLALSVHGAVCGMPVAIKARCSPGVLIEDSEFMLSAGECQLLDCMFAGDHTREIHIDRGKYMGKTMFASTILDHQGLRNAAIGIIDTMGMLSLKSFVADYESINRQLDIRYAEDKHLIRKRH